MALKTREDYIKSLKALRPNVYKFGELIEDVTTHPATRRTVESHARGFDAAHDPKYAEDFTTVSTFTGEKIHRWNSMMESMEDVIANSKLKRVRATAVSVWVGTVKTSCGTLPLCATRKTERTIRSG